MAYDMVSDLTAASSYAAGDLIEMETEDGVSVKSTFIAAMLGNDGPNSGLDAATVSGFGIGTIALCAETSFDTITSPGNYAINTLVTVTNPPPVLGAGNRGSLIVRYEPTFGGTWQEYRPLDSDRVFIRNRNSANTWGTWGEVFNSFTDGLDSALEAGDAGKVSRYGIGVTTSPAMVTTLDTYKTGGLFHDPGSLTNSPFGSTPASILVLPLYSGVVVQQAVSWDFAPKMATRVFNGSWGNWATVFNSLTDGNGGQPPAPKPTSGTPAGGANAQGQVLSGSLAAGETLHYSGASDLAGTWEIKAITFSTTAWTIYPGFSYSSLGAIGAGAYFVVPTGYTTLFSTIRIA